MMSKALGKSRSFNLRGKKKDPRVFGIVLGPGAVVHTDSTSEQQGTKHNRKLVSSCFFYFFLGAARHVHMYTSLYIFGST